MLPARSQQQYRMLQAVCNGDMDPPGGMTREQACEFVRATRKPEDLPRHAVEDIMESLQFELTPEDGHKNTLMNKSMGYKNCPHCGKELE